MFCLQLTDDELTIEDKAKKGKRIAVIEKFKTRTTEAWEEGGYLAVRHETMTLKEYDDEREAISKGLTLSWAVGFFLFPYGQLD